MFASGRYPLINQIWQHWCLVKVNCQNYTLLFCDGFIASGTLWLQ